MQIQMHNLKYLVLFHIAELNNLIKLLKRHILTKYVKANVSIFIITLIP